MLNSSHIARIFPFTVVKEPILLALSFQNERPAFIDQHRIRNVVCHLPNSITKAAKRSEKKSFILSL